MTVYFLAFAPPSVAVADTVWALGLAFAEANVPPATVQVTSSVPTLPVAITHAETLAVALTGLVTVQVLALVPPSVALADTVWALGLAPADANVPPATVQVTSSVPASPEANTHSLHDALPIPS